MSVGWLLVVVVAGVVPLAVGVVQRQVWLGIAGFLVTVLLCVAGAVARRRDYPVGEPDVESRGAAPHEERQRWEANAERFRQGPPGPSGPP
jgi:hypothetical protein